MEPQRVIQGVTEQQVEQVTDDIRPLVAEVKAGYRTSEFWLHLAVTVAGAIVTVVPDSTVAKVVGAISAVVSASVYSVGRVMVKKG